MTPALSEYIELGLTFRPGTFDEYIVKETKGYFPLGLNKDDVVLDLGGHIGAFAARAKVEGKCEILSVEANPDNYAILEQNANALGFNAMHAAVTGEDKAYVDMYVNDKKNNAAHSTVKMRGRRTIRVNGVSFEHLLGLINPTVIKCDIEGAEYELPWDKVSSAVRLIVAEIHLCKKCWRNNDAPAMINTIENLGFKRDIEPRIGTKNWTTVARWYR